MKVVRAGILGFCMGVRRAVEMARRESGKTGCRVYTFGPLIHNPSVLDDLKERGIKVLEESEAFPKEPEYKNSTVIIRAHGVSPRTERELGRQGFHILDATCPHVKVSQTKARAFAERGYRIFLAGEKKHAEITGIRGYVEDNPCYVVGNPEEAEKAASELFRSEPNAQTVLIGQTTISPGEYRAIGEQIRYFFPSLEILDTICGATADRQGVLRELCSKVDALIIAGGRESANTRRLLSLALELGKPAWLVETAGDIPPEIGSYKTVGLSAGASTPDSLIAEIEETLKAM